MSDTPRIGVRRLPGKGRGVVALVPLAVGEVVERAPTVALSAADTDALPGTVLDDYYFAHPADPEGGLMVLGLSALCNHADDPTAETRAVEDPETGWTVHLVGRQALAPGEELTRRYAGPLWFPPA